MDNFKLDLFIEEYGQEFPQYSHLSEFDCLDIVERLTELFDINFKLNVDENLLQKQHLLENTNAKDNFRLLEVLENLDINPSPNIYINWYQFRDIDLIKTFDLDKYFYDIWFPSADDIDLFDENFNWIISIRHDGVITYLLRPSGT